MSAASTGQRAEIPASMKRFLVNICDAESPDRLVPVIAESAEHISEAMRLAAQAATKKFASVGPNLVFQVQMVMHKGHFNCPDIYEIDEFFKDAAVITDEMTREPKP